MLINDEDDEGGEGGTGELKPPDRFDLPSDVLQTVREKIRHEIITQGIAGNGQELPEDGTPSEGAMLEQHPLAGLFSGISEKMLKTIDVNTIDTNAMSPELKLRLEQKLGKQLQHSTAPIFKPL